MSASDPIFVLALVVWVFAALTWLLLHIRDSIVKHKVINPRPKRYQPQHSKEVARDLVS